MCGISSTFAHMKNNENFESVRLPKETVEKVREAKKDTGVPIATFFAKAAEEKLENQKNNGK